MTTKILTLRVQSTLYATLCRNAGEAGVSISAHVRSLVERQHEFDQIDNLRRDLLNRLDKMAGQNSHSDTIETEVLLLCRGIATHLNPHLVTQAQAKLIHKV